MGLWDAESQKRESPCPRSHSHFGAWPKSLSLSLGMKNGQGFLFLAIRLSDPVLCSGLQGVILPGRGLRDVIPFLLAQLPQPNTSNSFLGSRAPLSPVSLGGPSLLRRDSNSPTHLRSSGMISDNTSVGLHCLEHPSRISLSCLPKVSEGARRHPPGWSSVSQPGRGDCPVFSAPIEVATILASRK